MPEPSPQEFPALDEPLFPGLPPHDPNTLFPDELFWRDHQVWLEEKGYMLRPRYRPDWVPSWKDIYDSDMCEDGVFPMVRL